MPKKRKQIYSNSISSPLFNSASYYFESTEDIISYHEKKINVGRYGRYDNPNWLEVEEKLASIDECEEALLFPSGMSAISTTLFSLLNPNDIISFTGKGYRNIQSFCNNTLSRFNVIAKPLSQVEMVDPLNYLNIASPRIPRVIFIEMPSNPHLYLTDIELIASNKNEETILIVDSTFSSPINFKPKLYGADLVIHSCGKYIGGHLDLMAGSVSGDKSLIGKIRILRNQTGAITDSNTASLLNRSLFTLDMRMKYLNESGEALAEFLIKHPKIDKVFYPSKHTQNFHQNDLATKYLSGYGGVVSFEVKGDKNTVSKFIDNLKIPYMSTNFGSNYSLVEQCSIFTYYHNSIEENERLGITDNIVRYSCGFEPVSDIIDDISQALNKI